MEYLKSVNICNRCILIVQYIAFTSYIYFMHKKALRAWRLWRACKNNNELLDHGSYIQRRRYEFYTFWMYNDKNRVTFITCVYNKFRMVEILHSLMLYEYLLLSIWSIYILPCKKCLWCAQRIWNQRRGKSSFTYFTIIKLSGVSKTSIARIIPKLTYCIEKLKKKQRE